MQDRLHQELSDFSSHDPELRINIGIGRNRGSIWLSSVTVSYTHLDVYKRQGSHCGYTFRSAAEIGVGVFLMAAQSQGRTAGAQL